MITKLIGKLVLFIMFLWIVTTLVAFALWILGLETITFEIVKVTWLLLAFIGTIGSINWLAEQVSE